MTPLFALMPLTRPSSDVSRLRSKSVTLNFTTLSRTDAAKRGSAISFITAENIASNTFFLLTILMTVAPGSPRYCAIQHSCDALLSIQVNKLGWPSSLQGGKRNSNGSGTPTKLSLSAHPTSTLLPSDIRFIALKGGLLFAYPSAASVSGRVNQAAHHSVAALEQNY